MRRWTRYMLLVPVLAIVQALSSCSTIDGPEDDGKSPVEASLAFTVSSAAESKTRMSIDVVQVEGQQFRGMKSLLVIPFTTNGEPVKADNMPLISTVSGNDNNKVANNQYYYFDKCYMSRGTNYVLVYGQAADITGKTASNLNGKLETNLVDRMLPNDITFSLSSIRSTTDVDADAQALASYITTIANTTGWSTTSNEQMKALYLDFINAQSEGNGLMAGSAAHVKAYVNALKQQIENNTDALSIAILANINADAKSCLDNGYPSASTSLGLPDGAAALRWSNNAFKVCTTTTTLDNINNITRWTYPAELRYYANSGIQTSKQDVTKPNYEGQSSWSSLLTNYYKAGNAVTGETKSVAVKDPLQYGVACLQMTLNKITGTLKDAKDQTVTYQASQFPLKAIIIGGQHSVGFDFKPKEPQSDVDARFIYDTVVGSANATTGNYTVNTLVFQTYDGEKVPVILEFENKTGSAFHGKDGIIYPDTKFYLIAQIDPANSAEPANKPEDYDDIKKRVFTQDHTTEMTMSVISLANAYSCMPDLLAPRLEIGVQVTTQWIQSTTTTVIL